MAVWFEASVKYMKTNEEGRTAKVSEGYMVDALSFTEAEARIVEEMAALISGEYYLNTLKKSIITEIVYSDDENDDRWYRAKVCTIDADEVSGKEKSTPVHFLIAAHSIDGALANLKKELQTYSVDWEICSVADTKIMDVFRYKPQVESEQEI